MKVKLNRVRVDYFQGFEPKEFTEGDGKPRFGARFVIPKGHPDIKNIQAEIERSAKDLWKEKAAKILTAIRASGDTCLKDGDTSTSERYEGCYTLAAYAPKKYPPLILDNCSETDPSTGGMILDPITKKPKLRVLKEDTGRIYDGCFVNATVDIYAFDKVKNQVNAKLLAIQYVAEGDAFSMGERPSMSDFDDLSEGADAGDVI